ncbi:DUF418 domain-containing protein [Streptomyces sp. NPDC047072]|uniref:DUF418 domain-containing protein n=1 Tax=Streptomyces sp. NPDC047072 TaxID=3154809 RepID=UPI0033DD7A98
MTSILSERSRVPDLDILRGFALLGILIVNALMMAGPYYAFGGGPHSTTLDHTVAWLVAALVATKFYVLFSFLFGYSFVLQQRSAERAGASFAPRHLRRTLGLLGLGALHAVVLYPGDILTAYACLALLLYAMRGLTPRTAIRVAVGLITILSALLLARGLLNVAYSAPFTVDEYAPYTADFVTAHRGDPLSVLAVHLRELPSHIEANLIYAPEYFAAFLAGLAAAKARLVERRGQDRQWLRRTFLRCLPVGLAGGVVTACCGKWPLDYRWFDVGYAAAVLTGPALTASYACGILLLLSCENHKSARRTATWLAASGRMALTHYLTQSLVLACVFTGYGLGRYDRLGTATVVAGCFLLYGVQLALGKRLMGRRRYGPVELLLRTVTLGRRPAISTPAPSPDRPPASASPPPAR